jgi:hypothetical protein
MNDETTRFVSTWPIVQICVSSLSRRDVCLVLRSCIVSTSGENVVAIHCAVKPLA